MSKLDENQKEIKKRFRELEKTSYVRECFHKDEKCSVSIISAHSIQNNKILKRISENGDVLYFSRKDHDGTKFLLSKTGRKKATTFTGFCQYHDNTIFSFIENKDYQENNTEQEFLLAYRALAKEYHAKKTAKKISESAIKQSSKESDINLFKNYLLGANQALKELKTYKEQLNEALDNKNFDILETRTIKLHREYKIAVSSFFAVENDFKGDTVNLMSDFSKELKAFCLTIFPQSGKTYILFSYLKKHKKTLAPVLTQIQKNKGVNDIKKIISNIIAFHTENFVISPNTWDKIPKQEQVIFNNIFFENLFCLEINLSKLEDINLFIE